MTAKPRKRAIAKARNKLYKHQVSKAGREILAYAKAIGEVMERAGIRLKEAENE